jgi:cytochrome P450
MIAGLEPEIRRIFTELLDAMQGKTQIDVVDDFAFPGPVTVICKVLGVPVESIPRFHGWIETALDGLDFGPEASDPEQQRRAAAVPAVVAELKEFLGDLFDQYRKQPGPGMLSGMVNDDGPEGRLSQESLVNNAMLMLFAGHETTVNLIAHSVLSLLRHPDQLEKLRRRPELIVTGIEELLRFESSVQLWHTRSAIEDIEIAGTTIPAGATIFLCYGSANRDPERFENPNELDLERPDNQHVGYSQGIHYCFGAPLARLEVQTAVSEFFRRVENPRLVEDPPPYRRNQIFRGPLHVPADIDGIRD